MSAIEEWRRHWERAGIEYGLCLCGCGETTTVAKHNHPLGHLAGEPKRFIHNHAHRKSPVEYREADCGYDTPCWVWQRSLDGKGYGNANRDRAHRVYYERVHGAIPPNHDLHHKCENPPCVNPEHLQPLTRSAHLRLRADTILDATQVSEIKRRLLDRRGSLDECYRELAPEFGVSRSTIRAIYYGNSWADVPAVEVVI